jgi:hypothetical protein
LEVGRVPEVIIHAQTAEEEMEADATTEEVAGDQQALNSHQLREMQQLSGFFDSEAQKVVESSVGPRATTRSMTDASTMLTAPNSTGDSGTRESADAAIDALFDAGNFGYNYPMFAADPDVEAEEPKNFQAAWYHPDLARQAKWRNEIGKEFQHMEKRKVWT